MIRNRSRFSMFSLLFLALLTLTAMPLEAGVNDVHLLQSFVYDAVISQKPYLEGGLLYVDYEFVHEMIFGARAGIPFNAKTELVVQLAYVNISDEIIDALNGLSDCGFFARFLVVKNKNVLLSVGPFITLPIGAEEVGQHRLDFGGFGAIRYLVNRDLSITGNFGIEFLDIGDDRELSPFLGTGVVYQVSSKLGIMAEWTYRDFFDYVFLSGGIDLKAGPGRIRGGMGIGLDNGAPDWMIAGGYLIHFK